LQICELFFNLFFKNLFIIILLKKGEPCNNASSSGGKKIGKDLYDEGRMSRYGLQNEFGLFFSCSKKVEEKVNQSYGGESF
jgi:hypothetical protein